MVKGEQLNRLLAGYFDRGEQTLEMQLPDGLSSNKHDWAAAAYENGRETIVTTKMMKLPNKNDWFAFSNWPNVKSKQVGNLLW